MIPKIGLGRGMRGLVAYISHDPNHAETSERVAWTHGENLATSDPLRATAVMVATTNLAAVLKKTSTSTPAVGRKLEKTVIHLSLSWPPDLRPSQDEMIKAGRQAMTELGVSEHQALFVAHDDERHKHVHLAICRVHPVTGKAAPLSNSKLVLSRWAERWESERRDVRCYERVLNNARRRTGEFVRYEPAPEQAKARQAVRYVSADAFQAACRDVVRPALWSATSREDADRRLAELGLRIEDVKRGGQVITDGTHQAKLSAVAAGLAKLETAWRANAERSNPLADAADAGVDRKLARTGRASVEPRGEDQRPATAADAPGQIPGTEQGGPDRAAAHGADRGTVGDPLDAAGLERALEHAGQQRGAAADRVGQRVDQIGRDAAPGASEGREDLGPPGERRDGDRGRERQRHSEAARSAVLDGGRGLGLRPAPERRAGPAAGLDAQPDHTAAAEPIALASRTRAAVVADAIARAAEAAERARADTQRRQLAAVGAGIAASARGFTAGLRGQDFGQLEQDQGTVSQRADRAAGWLLGAAEEPDRGSDGLGRRPVHDYAAAAGWAIGRAIRGPFDIAHTGFRTWRENQDRKLLDRFEVRTYIHDNETRVGIWDRQADDGDGRIVDYAPARAQNLLADRLVTAKAAQEARHEAQRALDEKRREMAILRQSEEQAAKQQREKARRQELAEVRGFLREVIVSAGEKPGLLRWGWPDQLSAAECDRRNDLMLRHSAVIKPELAEVFRQRNPAACSEWRARERADQGQDRGRDR